MPTIIPKDEENLVEIATKLIAAAGDDQTRIKTVTAGNGATAFEVDDELAAAIVKKPAAPKKATPTTAAKPSTD